jgi:hypothetical protein
MRRNTALVFVAAAVALGGCDVTSATDEDGTRYAGTQAGEIDGSSDGDQLDGEPTDQDDQEQDEGDGGGAPTGTPVDATNNGSTLSTGCTAYGSDVYTPFPGMGPVTKGDVAQYPWRGPKVYPDSIEDFRLYGPSLPEQVECGSSKGARDHLDVTAGCLKAVLRDGDKRGQVELTSTGYYRSFALPHDASSGRRVAWRDQGVEYRFMFTGWTGTAGNPGFKAFTRYLTEYDLYVASWRRDGTVQIQKKHCGKYTILKRDSSYGAPAPNVWHTIRFEAVGNQLRLYLDGRLAMTATDNAIPHGTTGIRIDSANGSFIDDWRAYAP